MTFNTWEPFSENRDTSFEKRTNPIDQNIESILAFYAREEQKISHSQRLLERFSGLVGRPAYLGSILLFVVLWIFVNLYAREQGLSQFDTAPFAWLQGILSLVALLTTIVILIRQDRLSKLEERRAHLDLQINLLTEQKTSKLIKLLEELRRDLPMVKDRHDPEAMELQRSADPELVLAALDEKREPQEQDEHQKIVNGTPT